jgi:methylamine---glutamate N-methyltransferase subunit A
MIRNIPMCGIVGLFLKRSSLEPELGALFSEMLVCMSSRGPDSAGFAVYGTPAPAGKLKVILQHPNPDFDWPAMEVALAKRFSEKPSLAVNSTHGRFLMKADVQSIRRFLEENFPEVRVMSVGRRIEIMKETGSPESVVERFGLRKIAGSHAIGHTRMATESAVTTEGSHPFSTGVDLCLVHNGSLSNHNRLRQWLVRKGIEFHTENDTEVAAGYFAWQLANGTALKEALEAGLKDLDGFYTFAVGTEDGFAVLRDPIACKPAVLAETDDYVAMASEYRSLANLPGIESARLWEPEPAVVYNWSRREGGEGVGKTSERAWGEGLLVEAGRGDW